MKTTDLELHMKSFAEFGEHILDKQLLCVLNLFGEHHPVPPALFSSPEHEVLMVSYCGQWLSVLRRRVSCIVCRVSSVNI